jgi:pyruvyltransferase
MAEAYGIPNLWIEFGKPLIGGHFKFHDFFLSIARGRESPYIIEDYELSKILQTRSERKVVLK